MDEEYGDDAYHDDGNGDDDHDHEHDADDCDDANDDYVGYADVWAMVSDITSARRRYGSMLWITLPGARRSPGGRRRGRGGLGGRGSGEEFRRMVAAMPRAKQ